MVTIQRLKCMLQRYMTPARAEFLARKIMHWIDEERAERLKEFTRLFARRDKGNNNDHTQ